MYEFYLFFFFSSRRRHTRLQGDCSSDVCSSDLFLAELTLHPARKHCLLDLALDGALGGEIGHARELLRDRASAFPRASRNHVAYSRAQHGGKVEPAMLVKVPVLDGYDCAGEVGGHVLRGELVALEHAPRGEDLAVRRLDDERAWRGFDHQPSVGRDGDNAVGDVANGQHDEQSEHGGDRVPAARPECSRARHLRTGSNFGWGWMSASGGGERAGSRRALATLAEQEGPHRVRS